MPGTRPGMTSFAVRSDFIGTASRSRGADRALLLRRREILVAQRRRRRALDADEGLVGGGMARVATVGEIVEGGGELRAALRCDRLFELLDAWLDDGLDHGG